MSLIKVDPIWRPLNQQKIYRGLLDAMSYPGRVIDLTAALGGSRAELGILASVLDEAVVFADPAGLLSDREQSLLGSGCVSFTDADFVLHTAAVPPPDAFLPRLGDLYRPDRGATLILSGASVGEGSTHLVLEGPGIETTTSLYLNGFDPAWFTRRETWVDNFPIGVDLFLCDTHNVVGLPRTCRVELNG